MSISHEASPRSPTKLTYREYVLFREDGNRHEIIDGRHYMNAAPSPRHQFASRHIQFQLIQQIEIPGYGQVIDAPVDLQLSDCDVVQPDLVVVLAANRIITTTKIKGVPDLVVEILSPSSRDHDVKLKKQLYEQFGIPEYWIVDPENQSVSIYRRGNGGEYGVPATATTSISWSGIPGGATVELASVWQP